MKIISTLLVLFVAVEHFYIAWLEMTQIPSEKASELFNMPYEFMEQKRVQTLFSNQGLYNGFLAIGLVWARFAAPDNAVYGATILFLGFVLIAAAWGRVFIRQQKHFAQTRLAGIFGRRSRH